MSRSINRILKSRRTLFESCGGFTYIIYRVDGRWLDKDKRLEPRTFQKEAKQQTKAVLETGGKGDGWHD